MATLDVNCLASNFFAAKSYELSAVWVFFENNATIFKDHKRFSKHLWIQSMKRLDQPEL